MKNRSFGSTNSLVPALGQGTWYIEQAHRTAAIAALQLGIDRGMSHIDTAEMYGDGEAERVVGKAIRSRRDQVFLVSKVLPSNASRGGVRQACERSLKRLDTDYLDCYLLHWRGIIPLEETFAGFEDLHREGKIRSYGVSNFDVSDLEEALRIVGPGKLACNQVLYHLNERAIEHGVIPWCEAHNVAVVAYSPFGHRDFPGSDTKSGKLLNDVALEHGASSRQVALSYLTARDAVFAIPKAMTPAHIEENAAAGSLVLSEAELDRIDAAFPRGPWPGYLPMI